MLLEADDQGGTTLNSVQKHHRGSPHWQDPMSFHCKPEETSNNVDEGNEPAGTRFRTCILPPTAQLSFRILRTMDEDPEWYNTVDPTQIYSRAEMKHLRCLITLVVDARESAPDEKDLTQDLERVHQQLQQMVFCTSLSPILVKKSGLLDDEGLRTVFENRATI